MTTSQRSSQGRTGRVVGTLFGLTFGVVWLGGWSAATLSFDGMWGRALYRQLRAEGFPTVEGTVLASDVRTNRSSDGDSHSAEVRYRYVVDGRPYEGSTVRHGMKVSGRKHAEALSRRFPAESAVPVYYDPADPADAVLSPGLTGVDLFTPMFMLPFNVIMVGSWLAVVGWARRVFRPSPAGLPVVTTGSATRVRLPRTPAWQVAGIAAAAAAFVLVFALGIPSGFDPPIWLAMCGWGLIAGAALYAGRRVRATDPGEAGDLLVDEMRRILTLPVQAAGPDDAHLDAGRRERPVLRFDQVEAVAVDVTSKKDSDGDLTFKYHPTIAWRGPGGTPHSTRLGDLTDRDRADALADWLGRRVGVESRAADLAASS